MLARYALTPALLLLTSHEANMKPRMVVGSIPLLLLLATVPAQAQTTVEGGVVVQSGPVTGSVEVGSPARETVREVIVVERTRVRGGKEHGWWKRHGYRPTTVYYDGSRYYGRRVARPGIRAVIVYQRGGQYYLGDEDGERTGRRHREHDEHDEHEQRGEHGDD